MKARRYNSVMPAVNEKWAAKVLGMDRNLCAGADLESDTALTEVKFFLVVPSKKYPRAWTVQDHQTRYGGNGKPFYWALGQYKLDRQVNEIPGRTKDQEKLESFVTARILHIVQEDWMLQYKPSRVRGETEVSQWESTFRYPKRKDLPKVTKIIPVEKGLVCITECVDLKDFPNL